MNIEYLNLLKSLTAIVPVYIKNHGKTTRLYLSSGEVKEVDFSFYKVLRDYCLIHYLNMNEIRKLSVNITGSRGMVPLYIRKDKILIPFKIYEKKGEEEKSFGYINIKEAKLNLDEKFILCKGGQKIYFHDKKTNVLKKLGQSELLSEKVPALEQWY